MVYQVVACLFSTNLFTPALIGAVGSLLAILLTPRLQHWFWKRQRRAELLSATLDEFHLLAAEFLSLYTGQATEGTGYPERQGIGEPLKNASRSRVVNAYPRQHKPPQLSDDFLRRWFAARTKVKCHFPPGINERFDKLDARVMNRVNPETPFADFVEGFQGEWTATLKAMYKEIGTL
jgi:hypothetical protein